LLDPDTWDWIVLYDDIVEALERIAVQQRWTEKDRFCRSGS